MMRSLLVLLALLLALPLRAQEAPPTERLEAFVARVARLWEAEDAAAVAALAPRGGRMVMELEGGSAGAVQERHAAAALRALFSDRESVSIRATRVNVAGGRPVQGFGELTWVSRSRRVTVPQTHTVYVGAVWEEDGWRIRELRLLP